MMKQHSAGPAHSHYFASGTSHELGHTHTVQLFTYPVNGTAFEQHMHSFQGVTAINEGHFHRITGMTGPAIPFSGFMHTHPLFIYVNDEPFEFKEGYYETILSIPRHTHVLTGRTDFPVGFEPLHW